MENASFASLLHPAADPDAVVKLLLSHWQLDVPKVLISVTGSATSIVALVEPRLEHLFKEGLRSAAQSTQAWVITGGVRAAV